MYCYHTSELQFNKEIHTNVRLPVGLTRTADSFNAMTTEVVTTREHSYWLAKSFKANWTFGLICHCFTGTDLNIKLEKLNVQEPK